MTAIEPGVTNEISRRVDAGHLASVWGSGLSEVLATPVLVGFCEECCRKIVDPLLPDGQQTVGTAIRLRHMAATPVGMWVSIHSELVEVEGRRLIFRVRVRDEIEVVGEGEHERFIIDIKRFEKRVAEKAGRP